MKTGLLTTKFIVSFHRSGPITMIGKADIKKRRRFQRLAATSQLSPPTFATFSCAFAVPMSTEHREQASFYPTRGSYPR